jgi:hypothetical protein|tara:strand:+ start:529 stop:894 length:366 start_codon:yes stop_codon:yes gene_type:complete
VVRIDIVHKHVLVAAGIIFSIRLFVPNKVNFLSRFRKRKNLGAKKKLQAPSPSPNATKKKQLKKQPSRERNFIRICVLVAREKKKTRNGTKANHVASVRAQTSLVGASNFGKTGGFKERGR